MELKYILYLILIYFYIKVSDGYTLDPPSGKIDIIESGSYIFGIENLKGLKNISCEYTSDTGIGGNFELINKGLLTNFKTNEIKAGPNSIKDLGDIGECKVQVNNVNDHGPKMWNMTAYRNKTEVLRNAVFSVTFYYAIAILQSQIAILDGTGIFNYLKIKDKNIVLCKLKMNDTEIELDMKSAQQIGVRSAILTKSENTLERMFSLGENLCGFKIMQVIKAIDDNFLWSLTAIDNKGKMYRSNFDLDIENVTPAEKRHFTKSVYFNQYTNIDCGCRFANQPIISYVCNYNKVKQLYCELYKPDGTLVETTKNGTYIIERVSREHMGQWKFYIGHDHSIDPLEFTLDLVVKGAKTIHTWQNETSDYLNIGCKLVNFEKIRDSRYCRMIAPNNSVFHLTTFGATDRYLALGTDLTEGICSLQIKKPLKSFEIGSWKCEISPINLQLTGAFIAAYSTAVPDYSKRISMTTFLKEKLEITCRVPYFSEYCYVRAPNGTIYQTMNRLDMRLGICKYSIKNVERSDNGTWKCFYAHKTGFPDDEISVEIFVADVLKYYNHIEVDVGDDVELMCSSSKVPLQYCRFISPKGVGYQIRKDERSPRINYHGEGFEYGDCGIKISNIQKDEEGIWQCVTRLYGRDFEEAVGRIEVEIISSGVRNLYGAGPTYTNLDNIPDNSWTLQPGHEKLKNLLSKWGFPDLLPLFEAQEINLQRLKLLTGEDLKELLRNYSLGLRVECREKLLEWRADVGRISTASTSGTFSIASSTIYFFFIS